MSFSRLVLFVSLLAVFTMATRFSADSDTWWHLRAGSWMVEERRILDHDPFSLPRNGEPWVDHSWLAEIALALTHRAFGLPGLNLLTGLTVLLAFAFLWHAMEGVALLRGFVLLLAASTSAIYWSARPQIFSFALSAIFLWVLETARLRNRGRLWALPFLMLLWANLHAGFALGFLLLLSYIVGALVEALLHRAQGADFSVIQGHLTWIAALVFVGFACALATVVNPFGLRTLLLPLQTVSVGALRAYIEEWQSPDFHALQSQPFLWLLFSTSGALAAARGAKRATEFVQVFGFAYLGFVAARNVAMFALVAAPILARHGQSILTQALARRSPGPPLPERMTRMLNVLILALVSLLSLVKVAGPLSTEENERIIREQVPVQAAAFLREEGPPGPLFNSYNWGGYVLWSLYPKYRSFVDGRTDLFGDEILGEYLLAWRAGEGWERVLERWGIRLVLLEVDAPLATALRLSGWQELYRDPMAVVLRPPSRSAR